MSDPVGIQRRRTKGWRMPVGAVYVGRPTEWGNPYWVGGWRDEVKDGRVETTDEAVRLFREQVAPWLDLAPLRGKDLACYCPLDQPCHRDVLLELANA